MQIKSSNSKAILEDNTKYSHFILNIILWFFLILSTVALGFRLVWGILGNTTERSVSPFIPLAVILVFVYLLNKTRKNHYLIPSIVSIFIFLIISLFQFFQYGFDVAQGLLCLTLTTTLTGILLNNQIAKWVFSLSIISYFSLGTLQLTKVINYNALWKQNTPSFIDVSTYTITICIIFTIAWFYNSKQEQTLKRAMNSEADLLDLNQHLEQRVAEARKEIHHIEIGRSRTNNRLLQIGKKSSELIHDLRNHLTSQILNLETADLNIGTDKNHMAEFRTAIQTALLATKKMEEYILSTQEQIDNNNQIALFYPSKEIEIALKAHKALIEANNIIVITDLKEFTINANPLSFYKIFYNVFINAVEALENNNQKDNKKIIKISLIKNKQVFELKIEDNGCGISEKNRTNLFDQSITTKNNKQDHGIGLSICKETVENEFKGNISVSSKPGRTIFTIYGEIQHA